VLNLFIIELYDTQELKLGAYEKEKKITCTKKKISKILRGYQIACKSRKFLKKHKFKRYPNKIKSCRAGLMQLGWDRVYRLRWKMLRGKFKKVYRYKYRRWGRKLH